MARFRKPIHLLAWLILGLGGLVIASFPTVGYTSDEDEDENPFLPGLLAEYRDGAGRAWRRLDATPSLASPRLAESRLNAPSPPTVLSGLKVQWRGLLEVQAETTHRLAIFGVGRATVRLDGKVVVQLDATEPGWQVSEPLPLVFQRYPLTVDYETLDSKAAPGASANPAQPPRFSLFWSSDQFPLEPIAARHFQHARVENAKQVVETNRTSHGHDLVRALRCDACHRVGSTSPANDDIAAGTPRNPQNTTSAPNAIVSPSLERLGGLLSPEWLRRHLAASPPNSATTGMKTARGVSSDSSADSAKSATDAANADGPANGSDVASEETLVRRMPYFSLKDSEIADLAAYLLS
ncbi:MAG: hypothetical protein ACKO38_15935, partial [Planctomycetota bacterium]